MAAANPIAPTLLDPVGAAFLLSVELDDTGTLVVRRLIVVLDDSEVTGDVPESVVMVATMTTVLVMVEVVSIAKAARGMHATRKVEKRMLNLYDGCLYCLCGVCFGFLKKELVFQRAL